MGVESLLLKKRQKLKNGLTITDSHFFTARIMGTIEITYAQYLRRKIIKLKEQVNFKHIRKQRVL